MRVFKLKYFVIINLVLASVIVQAQSVGNYTVSRTTGNTYTSIESTGSSFSAWRYTGGFSEDDNRSVATEIGFDFWYNGARYTEFSVSTNGFLDFSSSTDDGGPNCDDYGYCNSMFSDSNIDNGTWLALAPFYDDMTTAGGSDPLGSSIKYLVSGTAPNRVLTVEWIGMAVYNNTSPDVNFQVKLYETSGIIEYWYGTMDNGTNTFSYTIGINAASISNPPDATELLTQQTANNATFNNTAQNGLSAMPTANSKLTFIPLTPANPTGSLTFSAITNTGMTLNWLNWATNEVGYVLYYSLDNINYFFHSQVAVNSTSSVIAGLLPSTTYYWRVYAVTEGTLSNSLNGNATTLAPGTVTSLSDGRWDQTARWDCGCIPTAADNVIVNHNVRIARADAVTNDLTINSGGIVRFLRGTSLTLSINGDLSIANGGQFYVNSNSNTTHTVSIGGDIVNNGSILLDVDANSNADIVFVKANGDQSISGAGTTNTFYTLNLDKSLKSNTLEITSDVFICNVDALNFISGGTFKFSSSGTNTFSLFNSTRSIPSKGKIIMNSTNSTMSFAGGIDLQGDMQIIDGAVNVGDAADENLTVNGGQVLIEGGALNIAGRLDRNTTESATHYTQTGGTLTLPTVSSSSTTLAPFNADVTGSLFSMSAGTIIVQREGGDGGQDLGIITTGVTQGSVTGGTLQIGDAQTPAAQIIEIELGASIGNLIVNSANVTASIIGSDLDVLADVSLLAGTLSDNGNNITVSGDWLATSGTYTSTGIVDFIGSNQSITSGGTIFNDVIMNGSGTKSIQDNTIISGDITINSTLGLASTGLQIDLGGNWINDGSFTRNNETLALTGSAAQSIQGSSLNAFTNITINKTGGAISNVGQLDLYGTLTVSSSTAFDLDGSGSGEFRLVSNASEDARIASLAAGASLSGNMIFEKYFGGTGFSYWRHISSGVTGSTVADLQGEILVSGFFTGSDNGTNGIHPDTHPSLYYYDPTTGLGSETEDDRWVNYPSATNAELLTTSGSETRGYAAWLWDASPTTYSLTGTPNFGSYDFNISSSNEGWNLLGNPYPSDIDWDAAGWTKSNIQGGAIHVWNGSSYLTWNGISGSLGNGRIAKGQGFWVQAVNTPQLISTEPVKTATAATTYRIDEANLLEEIIELTLDASGYQDKTYIQFNEEGKSEFDIMDAGKLGNAIFNLATLTTDSVPLSINVLKANNCEIVLPLKIDNTWIDNYTLRVNASNELTSGYDFKILDSVTEEEILIDKNNPRFEFSITEDASSQDPFRFTIYLTPRALDNELVVDLTQVCEEDKTANIILETSQINAMYEVYINNTLDTIINGTGSSIEYLMQSNLTAGLNNIDVKTIGLGCLEEEDVATSLSINIIETPIIQYDQNTNLIISINQTEGLWYRDNELLSTTPTSFIEPDNISGGVYFQEVANENCSRRSNEFLVTDVGDELLSDKLTISPNPASERILVEFTGRVDNVRITDITGRLYYEHQDLPGEINVSDFDTGIYLVTIYSGQEKFTRRFIKH